MMSLFGVLQRINGLDVQQLLSNEPEAKVTQLHTLQDILSEAEDDEVFQTIVNEAKSSNQVGEIIKLQIFLNKFVVNSFVL